VTEWDICNGSRNRDGGVRWNRCKWRAETGFRFSVVRIVDVLAGLAALHLLNVNFNVNVNGGHSVGWRGGSG